MLFYEVEDDEGEEKGGGGGGREEVIRSGVMEAWGKIMRVVGKGVRKKRGFLGTY